MHQFYYIVSVTADDNIMYQQYLVTVQVNMVLSSFLFYCISIHRKCLLCFRDVKC